jgi:hypothetical protein
VTSEDTFEKATSTTGHTKVDANSENKPPLQTPPTRLLNTAAKPVYSTIAPSITAAITNSSGGVVPFTSGVLVLLAALVFACLLI